MTTKPRSFAGPMLFASAATLVAVLAFAAFIFVGSIPTQLLVIIRSVSVVVPPALLAVAIALLVRRFQSSARVAPSVFAGLTFAGAVATLIFSLSFSAGMDDADAGRPTGFLGSITWLAALLGVGLLTAAIAVLVFTLLSRSRLTRTAKLLIATGSGALGGAACFLALLVPSNTAIAGFALVLALAELTSSRSSRPAATSTLPTSSPASDPRERAASLARRMGALALAVVAVVWGVGAVVGFTQAGLPVATVAMGVSAGAAQFAAVPLIVAAAAIGQACAPRLGWRRFSVIALAGTIAGTTIQLVALSPDGSGVFTGATITGLSLGVWLALTLLRVAPLAGLASLAVGVAITVGGCLAWFVAVPMSGAITLAIPAAILAFGGARRAVGLAPRVVTRQRAA